MYHSRSSPLVVPIIRTVLFPDTWNIRVKYGKTQSLPQLYRAGRLTSSKNINHRLLCHDLFCARATQCKFLRIPILICFSTKTHHYPALLQYIEFEFQNIFIGQGNNFLNIILGGSEFGFVL